MKLRNKKTGEIIDIYKGEITLHYNQGRKTIHFKRLEDLEAWEDYEEPKPWWYIDITLVVKQGELFLSNHVEQFKTVGNYFETREEAEKAVEKLKAWKRLKDNGFRFNGWNGTRIGSNISYISEIYYEGCSDDMDLLFGGEE